MEHRKRNLELCDDIAGGVGAGREALGLRGPPPRKDSARPLLLSDNGLEKLCL